MARPTILFIDDDANILLLFQAAMAKSCYPVETMRSGESALEFLAEETPALVVVDIAMPLISGIDIIEFLKHDPRFAETKIIILTAAPSRVTPEIAEVVDRVVAKPITPRVLQTIIYEIIPPCD